MKSVTGLSEICALFDVFFIDLSGVVYDGEALYPGANACVRALKEAGKQVVFLSNMPRGGDITLARLHNMGLDVADCEILTSGDMVRRQLLHPTDDVFTCLGPKIYHFGAQHNTDLLKDLDVSVVEDLEAADYVLLTKYFGPNETIAESKPFLQACLQRGLPMVCVNPDISTIHDGQKRYTSGYIGEEYARMGGTVHYYGKPHGQIYAAAVAQAGADKRYLMIGDNLDTDILGAQRHHMPSLLVMTGHTGYALQKDPEMSLKHYLQQHEKCAPTYVAPRFIW